MGCKHNWVRNDKTGLSNLPHERNFEKLKLCILSLTSNEQHILTTNISSNSLLLALTYESKMININFHESYVIQ